ncbi:hypothetical protein GBF38_010876 [Nibea albiflora]|uniref:Uncharacterized protein n=1 Tax=Nibea albiflora TaxID=240163 RepID=A0ACB7ET35_NIBAL|nr:hypothetical protein GBF38_010876 [Nibea albiflora]
MTDGRCKGEQKEKNELGKLQSSTKQYPESRGPFETAGVGGWDDGVSLAPRRPPAPLFLKDDNDKSGGVEWAGCENPLHILSSWSQSHSICFVKILLNEDEQREHCIGDMMFCGIMYVAAVRIAMFVIFVQLVGMRVDRSNRTLLHVIHSTHRGFSVSFVNESYDELR